MSDDNTVVYPRLIGVDADGDRVWELSDHQWTWAKDADEAGKAGVIFSYDPKQYVALFGQPASVKGESITFTRDELEDRLSKTEMIKDMSRHWLAEPSALAETLVSQVLGGWLI